MIAQAVTHFRLAGKSVARHVGQRFQAWLNRRIPASNEITLSQRSIFIVPSKTGWAFCLLLILLLITAINYQNSLIYGLVFWLFSIAISAMIFTYRNLAGITIKVGEPVFGFVGDSIEIPLRLSSQKSSHHGLVFDWNGHLREVDLAAQEKELSISYPLRKRGPLTTKRLKLQTRYPFGLYTCWTWVRLNTPGLVYPEPLYTPYIASAGEGSEFDTDTNLVVGNDEFLGLRSYQQGDSLKHIAWKYLAKGKGLLTKEYDNQQLSMQWFDWYSLQGMPQEQRLSHITGWVLQAEQEGRAYGLKLPDVTLAANIGDQHRRMCLKHLALYNLQPQETGQANGQTKRGTEYD